MLQPLPPHTVTGAESLPVCDMFKLETFSCQVLQLHSSSGDTHDIKQGVISLGHQGLKRAVIRQGLVLSEDLTARTRTCRCGRLLTCSSVVESTRSHAPRFRLVSPTRAPR